MGTIFSCKCSWLSPFNPLMRVNEMECKYLEGTTQVGWVKEKENKLKKLHYEEFSRILHIKNPTSNEIFSDIKLLINILHIEFMVYAFLKYKIEIRASDVHFVCLFVCGFSSNSRIVKLVWRWSPLRVKGCKELGPRTANLAL